MITMYTKGKIIENMDNTNVNNGIQLPETYRKNGYVFKKSKREGNICIYEQYFENQIIGYEVFKIQFQKEGEFLGRKIEEKELTPGNEKWGVDGFSCKTAEAANKKFTALKDRENEKRQIKTVAI